MNQKLLLVAPIALLAMACELSQEPVTSDLRPTHTLLAGPAHASGGGQYLLQGAFPMQFAFTAVQQADGRVAGQFQQKGDVGGVWVDVSGEVTCLSVDPITRRGWIGGVVTQNRSDADLQEAIHQPGQDVWFRFVDYGEGQAALPDRTSFLGFTGAAGIITSEDYCAARIWPDGDARTHAVTSGNIQVN
jgi:hypothetical protein